MKFAVMGADGSIKRWAEAATRADAHDLCGPDEHPKFVKSDDVPLEERTPVETTGFVAPADPPPTVEFTRTTRNRLINSSLWSVSRGSPLTSECQDMWELYIVALHKVDLTNPVWPPEPPKEYN